MQLKAQRAARVQLLSGLNAADRALTGVECVESAERAVRDSVAASGDNAVAVIPKGRMWCRCTFHPPRDGRGRRGKAIRAVGTRRAGRRGVPARLLDGGSGRLEPGIRVAHGVLQSEGAGCGERTGWPAKPPGRACCWRPPRCRAVIAHLGKYLLFSKSKLTVPTTGLRFAPASSPGRSRYLPPDGTLRLTRPPTHPPTRATPSSPAACATAGFVTVAPPIADAFLPQMVGLTAAGAVSFAKGCYLAKKWSRGPNIAAR